MDLGISIWILILPAASFAICGLFGHKFRELYSGLLATLSIAVSALISFAVAYGYFSNAGDAVTGYRTIIPFAQTWLRFGEQLHIDMGILLDPISVMMLVVITLVSALVHIYSLGYMKNDVGFARFFSFLSLFSFSMLGLVVATNIFQMYVFWELVGVSSYLLIGHYYQKPSAVSASKKAFVVTRFADLGFLIGILILSYCTGSFDFNEIVNPNHPAYLQPAGSVFLGVSTISWALILIFIGGAGKSAMFPLHIWLPDAMEGPTPVSALIHAATMVVAGIYLVARLFPIYLHVAPDALEVIAFTGAFTSLFAALIACTQEDIKRVLAYSTMSQLGYMMLALGVSFDANENLGFTASMFHLFNHAMFKALLFLGAGAAIHAVHSNVMGDMGGLRKYLPVTSATFLIACLAISGIPPFSGFFSKDEILVAALERNLLYFIVETLVAGLTAYYMFRLYFRIFWNKEGNYSEKPHEAPLVMTIPLMILAGLSLLTGFLPFEEFVSVQPVTKSGDFHWTVAITSTLVGFAGIALAMRRYLKPKVGESGRSLMYQTVKNKFYIDEIYLFITQRIIFRKISSPVARFDRKIVDGAMNGVAWLTNTASEKIREWQSGQLQDYLFAFISGTVILFLWILYLIN